MDIYEKNRALNLKIKMKEFFEECLEMMGTNLEDLYKGGQIFCLNSTESLMIDWMFNGISNDFAIFIETEDGKIKDYIHANITKNSEIVAYLHTETETTDEYGNAETEKEAVFLNSWKIPEYDARTFLNAIYINGEMKEEYNFTLDGFDFTINPEEYDDHITFWNGRSDITEEITGDE